MALYACHPSGTRLARGPLTPRLAGRILNLRGGAGTPLPLTVGGNDPRSHAGWPSPELEYEGANLGRPNPALHGFCGRPAKAPRPVRRDPFDSRASHAHKTSGRGVCARRGMIR